MATHQTKLECGPSSASVAAVAAALPRRVTTEHPRPRAVCEKDWLDIVQCLGLLRTRIETDLFHRALAIVRRSFSTLSLVPVPSLLDDLTDIWQKIVSIRCNVVLKGQTRTPPGLVRRMLSYIPPLLHELSNGTSSTVGRGVRRRMLHRTVLDPASGAGILVASLCLRALEQSSVVRHVIQAASAQLAAPCNNDSMRRIDEKLLADTKDQLRGLISCLHAVDIDATSCTFTRMSILCSLGPVLHGLHVLEQNKSGVSGSPWALPCLRVFCGSSPSLFQGRTRSASSAHMDAECPSKSLSFLWGRSFDIVVQNPPYRNLERDRLETSGAAFQFLTNAKHVSYWERCSFRHHNLYGYFLRLGLDRLVRGGIMIAVVLRNVFDLHKYPQDVEFHAELLRDTSILAVDYGCFAGTDREFRDLPMDIRHKRAGGIETVTLVLQARRPLPDHTFRVRAALTATSDATCGAPAATVSVDEYEQSGLLTCGFGVIDPILRSLHSPEDIRTQWSSLTQ